jgi:hypothetical protein
VDENHCFGKTAVLREQYWISLTAWGKQWFHRTATYTLTPLFETLLAMAHAILFEDIFELKQLNPDGKKFERGKDGKLSP